MGGRPHAQRGYLALTLDRFGTFYMEQGDYAQAVVLYLRAKKINDAGNDRDGPMALATLHNLGWIYTAMGEFTKAERLLGHVVKVKEAKLGDSPSLASSLLELTYLYVRLGQPDKAEPLGLRCLQMHKAKLGPDHPKTLNAIMQQGVVCRHLKKYDQTAAYYQQVLKALEAKHGPDSPELFFIVGSISMLQSARGQYSDALATSLRSLKMAETRFGADHPLTANNLSNIGDIHLYLREPVRAETYFLRALKINEARLGAEHPNTIAAVDQLAYVYAATGRWEQAIAAYDRALRANRRYIARILPALSEAQQLSFLNQDNSGYQLAWSAGVARSADRAVVRRSAEWLLNGKAIAQQALAERSLLARQRRPGTVPNDPGTECGPSTAGELEPVRAEDRGRENSSARTRPAGRPGTGTVETPGASKRPARSRRPLG